MEKKGRITADYIVVKDRKTETDCVHYFRTFSNTTITLIPLMSQSFRGRDCSTFALRVKMRNNGNQIGKEYRKKVTEHQQ